MARLKILVYPDPLLSQKCEPVTEFNSKLKSTIKDMFETMYDNGGCGLAAPQVGILKRFAVIDVTEDHSNPIVIINPEIIQRSGTVNCNEGCLSIPDYREIVKRSEKIKVSAQNMNGEKFELDAEELLSRCIQHEMDHMDGILFVNRVSPMKRQIFKRWMKKHTFVEEEEK